MMPQLESMQKCPGTFQEPPSIDVLLMLGAYLGSSHTDDIHININDNIRAINHNHDTNSNMSNSRHKMSFDRAFGATLNTVLVDDLNRTSNLYSIYNMFGNTIILYLVIAYIYNRLYYV